MKYVVCINNKGYEASLENRKIYPVSTKNTNDDRIPEGFISIIDESGETYMYAKDNFAPIKISKEIERHFN